MLRQTLKPEAMQPLGAAWFRPYPNGLVPNVPQGHGPAQEQRGARYVATSVVCPPSAVGRLERDDGARVTSHDRCHRTDRMEDATVPVDTCMGPMVPPTVAQGFKHRAVLGGASHQDVGQGQGRIQAALAKVEGVVRGAVTRIARLTYRQRDEQSTGPDP